MRSTFILTITTAITLAGCWVPRIPGDDADTMAGDGDGDGETSTETDTGEPLPDTPSGDGDGDTGDGDGDGDRGWCCECGTEPMACTPSSADACSAEGFTWCELDAEGNPSDCVSACAPEPEGWCCDCNAPVDGYPFIECWHAEPEDCTAYAWCMQNPLDGNLSECIAQCG